MEYAIHVPEPCCLELQVVPMTSGTGMSYAVMVNADSPKAQQLYMA